MTAATNESTLTDFTVHRRFMKSTQDSRVPLPLSLAKVLSALVCDVVDKLHQKEGPT